ncbi:caspase family protein [Candidatus Raskinella chloraquaticus]|uniref:Peptidase C14 caspase domain-containing protein n=1 Tax=Candidatus Raskinella chloraquaticus TaxID=1951219 RepID=A0A1W9HQ34_9HYPH|nr:MAG: hypothetical protein A4S15_02275 [Proteobacteria bacterium SG_bin8]
MRHRLAGFIVTAGVIVLTLIGSAQAQTRRAFLVGNNAYSDKNLQRLSRSVADVKDLEGELIEAGFDKKNIKRLENVKTKAEFDKQFDAFLKTVRADDIVFFHFSGHGFGIEEKQDNFLLMGDIKSPFTFTRSKLPANEQKDAAITRLRITTYLGDYQEQEVARGGVSTREITKKIAAVKPKAAIIVLDACRTLLTDDGLDSRTIERSSTSGSRLVPAEGVPPGFLILYSASFGEQAIEAFNQYDRRRNSLFTEVLRQEMIRPGQTAVELAERIKLVTRDIASLYGLQQEPEFYHSFDKAEDFLFIDSIGSERFKLDVEPCKDSLSDIKDIRKLPTREALDSHRRRFSGCETAEEARRLIAQIELGSDEQPDRCDGSRIDLIDNLRQLRPELLERHARRFEGCASAEAATRLNNVVKSPPGSDENSLKCQTAFAESLRQLQRENLERFITTFAQCPARGAVEAVLAALPPGSGELGDVRITRGAIRRIDSCDYFAASEQDKARPPEVPGVFFSYVRFEDAIEACEKSIRENPRISRYLFNLGRAYHRKGWDEKAGSKERDDNFRKARTAYADAEKRGYVSALNGLAVLLGNTGDGKENEDEIVRLLEQAAQQGHPLAMYNLARRYAAGDGILQRNLKKDYQRDLRKAYELFARAAEGGYVPAMVQAGYALRYGRGVAQNPRRAVETLLRAADAGSIFAKRYLGQIYFDGVTNSSDRNLRVEKDRQLALLFLSRAADEGDSYSRKRVAQLMEEGDGLPSTQPELAERFWRLAANGGDSEAQYNFAERLRTGTVLIRPEFGAKEAILLLQRAMAQGSAPAAKRLAEIYRRGELGETIDIDRAIKYAFQTIALASRTAPSNWAGSPYYEISAGHLLVEMARNGEAVDARGRPLFSADEIERLEKFYGKPDGDTKTVKVRRVEIPLYYSCENSKQRVPWRYDHIWIWDWGRATSPTEAQITLLEHKNLYCADNRPERQTLIASFETAKRNKVLFADLIEQQIRAAQLAEATKNSKKRK